MTGVTPRPTASRPGGRSARVQADVHRAVTELVSEQGADQVTIPAVAARAGVNPTTVYRRWRTVPSLLADVAAVQRDANDTPVPVGDLREDLAAYAEWVLADLSRPGGIAFFRAEVATEIDDRKAGLRECLKCLSVHIDVLLDQARNRGETPPVLERVFDRVIAPLYFRVVFSIPGTDAAYARSLVYDLLSRG